MIVESISQFFKQISPAGIVGAASCIAIAVAGVTAILVKHFKAKQSQRITRIPTNEEQ